MAVIARCGAIAWCFAGGVSAVGEEIGESRPASLEQVYREAKQLAERPENLPQAAAKYQAVVEAHLANEKAFHNALRELARYYETSGQTEAGVRFFLGLARQMEMAESRSALREIAGAFLMKHRQLTEKIAAEMGLSSTPQRRLPARAPSEELAKAILQREDQALRDQTLAKLREMLAPDSPESAKKLALATLSAALSAKFDRASFLPLVLPLLEAKDVEVRSLALRCLPGLGATANDLSHVIPLAEDPSPQVRMQVASALIGLGKGEHGEQVIPALMRLLRDEDPDVIERSIRSMWGQYSSPEFDELLIELSHEPRFHGNTVYFCLSTMRTKSARVCRRLVEELDDPDWNNSGRAAWGLTYGVADDAKAVVEEGLLQALPEETNPYTRKQEFRALRAVATEKSRGYLKSVVDSSMETAEFKELAQRILADLSRSH
jgi:hypothetical protein